MAAGLSRHARRGLALDDPDRLQARVESTACDWYYDDDGMLVLRARLMPDDGARLVGALKVVQKLVASVPAAARRAMALAAVAEAAVGAEPKGPVPEIVVHLSIGRQSRVVPAAMRRAMNARDQGCRFPGCSHEHFLHAHHIQHWSRQGETSLTNLVTLCSYHRMLLHEGGYSVRRMLDGSYQFKTPAGHVIPAAAPAMHGETESLRSQPDPLAALTATPLIGGANFVSAHGEYCDGG